MEVYRQILWASMPYALLIIGVLLLAILILKIILHFREKKQTSKPQDTSRFEDLLKLDEEETPSDGIGNGAVHTRH